MDDAYNSDDPALQECWLIFNNSICIELFTTRHHIKEILALHILYQQFTFSNSIT